MTPYNLTEANRAFVRWAAYLARDINYDPSHPLTEKRVEYWRELVMKIIQQHKAAHDEIRRLRRESEKGK